MSQPADRRPPVPDGWGASDASGEASDSSPGRDSSPAEGEPRSSKPRKRITLRISAPALELPGDAPESDSARAWDDDLSGSAELALPAEPPSSDLPSSDLPSSALGAPESADDDDEATRRLRNFKALPHFTGTAWQGAAAFPGGETGWAQLTAEGGHPGNTRAQGCVRRWTAPRDLTVSISGTLVHEPSEGDGVRGFLLASREGVLQSATVHHGKAELAGTLRVQAGDTIDFLVDIGGSLGYDQFLWNPVIVAGSDRWEARTGFSGPGAVQTPLAAWEQYAQVLLLTNEFAFVD